MTPNLTVELGCCDIQIENLAAVTSKLAAVTSKLKHSTFATQVVTSGMGQKLTDIMVTKMRRRCPESFSLLEPVTLPVLGEPFQPERQRSTLHSTQCKDKNKKIQIQIQRQRHIQMQYKHKKSLSNRNVRAPLYFHCSAIKFYTIQYSSLIKCKSRIGWWGQTLKFNALQCNALQ